ncbi:hypothetical protein BJ684DRAFT_3846, partial [Piptocephalis cylindrospora]
VLVLGGLTPVGRHLVTHLVEEYDVEVRVVDQQQPLLAFLNPKHQVAFQEIEFIQANLNEPAAIQRIFQPKGGSRGFDWVLNCASTARGWEIEEVWRQRFLHQPKLCAQQAVLTGVKAYVQMAQGINYKYDGFLNDESRPLQQLIDTSIYCMDMEKILQAIPDLPLIIIRPAIPWGLEEQGIILNVLCASEIFYRSGQDWNMTIAQDIQSSVVHILDIARGMAHLAAWYEATGKQGCVVYNLADASNASELRRASSGGGEGRLMSSLIPPIPYSYGRALQESLTKDRLLEKEWILLLHEQGISDSLLVPHFEKEYFTSHHMAVNGRAIVRDTGFQYMYDDGFTVEGIREEIDDYIEKGFWP